ncbi:hypothetical protein NQ314_001828 [Rhamnusium bicolor]|uniref:C2H2-type domain-containing protein n=1 Tax=Rhamnusium bicolor TaxID=1586634 RepID=A0AAV8ZUH1_9CUCU|nr:hypothetical protein NQ314_001828 [Rhamnusium bicolor]
MAFNYQGFCVKEEPKDDNEDIAELNNVIPNFGVKLEDDTFLHDKPEFVNLESNATNSYNRCELVRDDGMFYENITCMEENGKEDVSKDNSNYEDVDKSMDTVHLNDSNTVFEDMSHAVSNIIQQSSDALQDTAQSSSYEMGSESSSDENDGDYTCKVCKRAFLDEFELQLHFKSRRVVEKCYKCCSCEKMFRDNTQLNVHSRKHTGEQPYACKICGKKFSVNGNLSKHMRIHTGERRYECDTCERKFTQFAHLEDHMKTHSGKL